MVFCNLYERHLCDYELEQLCGLTSFNTNIETAETTIGVVVGPEFISHHSRNIGA